MSTPRVAASTAGFLARAAARRRALLEEGVAAAAAEAPAAVGARFVVSGALGAEEAPAPTAVACGVGAAAAIAAVADFTCAGSEDGGVGAADAAGAVCAWASYDTADCLEMLG